MTKSSKAVSPSINADLIEAFVSSVPPSEMFGKDGFFNEFKKAVVNKMLEGEMNHHLGYDKHSKAPKEDGNRRNGSYSKTIMDEQCRTMEVDVPRDRDGSFEPALIPKGVRKFAGFDDAIISMYARGMSVREIQSHVEDIYCTRVSADLISEVTDSVMDEVGQWQNRPLDRLYPIVYLDCLFIKIRDNHVVTNKAVYLAMGVNMEGQKEILGMWIQKTEGAKFWAQVLNELKNRGLEDILIVCVDGLKGFEDAIASVFPKAMTQLCIVHMIRNSTKYVPWKDKKAVCDGLKSIYTAPSEEEAKRQLELFEQKWGEKYPVVVDIWKRNWQGIIPFFAFPDFIRKAVYTTNAIEAVNRQIRKIIKSKGVFPDDNAVKKILFLALKNAQKKWSMPIRDWPQALNQFAILFDDRIKL